MFLLSRSEEPLHSLLLQPHEVQVALTRVYYLLGRRQWHPTPVFLPGESQGQGNLVGCHLWGRTELDTTEGT